MKKFLLPLLFLCFLSLNSISQTVLFSDDFESYTVDQKLAQQATGSPWTTWSGTVGSTEDATITTEQAYEGAKSAKVITNNDLVLDLGGKTSGRYQIEFYLFVASGKGSFVGFMQDFNDSDTEFGLSVYFNTDTGSLTAGGKEYYFDFNFDTWMLINTIIDLDDDFASFSIDGNLITAWKWSTGSDGSSGTLKLDGIDFWGFSENTGCQYYLDNVKYNQLDSYDHPTNLVSNNTGTDVSLSWSAPATGSPSGYAIFRNNIFVGETTNLTYNDMKVYPGTYSYTVRAIYGEFGLSAASNKSTEVISGGVNRKMVVYEIGTGTWCQFCPGAAMGVHDLIDNNLDVAVVKYHSGDEYEFNQGNIRLNYYSVGSFPTSKVDGILTYGGGSNTQSLYSVYKPFYDQRKEVLSTHNIEMEITKVDESNYHATITVTEEFNYFDDGLVLVTALTESNIEDSWQNQTEVNFACRALYPDANGTILDFSSSSSQVINLDFSVDASWVPENCELVAFIQHNSSKEIIQGIKSEIKGPSVEISIPDGSTNVALDKDIVFTFSDPIRHLNNEMIVNLDTMIIFKKGDLNGENITFTAGINEDLNQITIEHDSLEANTTYYIELSSFIENFYNQKVDDELSTTFTTVSATGIPENILSQTLNVYPNPFKDKLKITFSTDKIANGKIEIYNQTGMLIKSDEIINAIGNQEINFVTEGMPEGVYFLNINIDNQTITRKIVLIK